MAFSSASFGVRKVSTLSTGPKISSRAMRWACETPVNTVGGNQKPRSGRSQGADHRVGALVLADLAHLADPGQLRRGVDRADVGVLVERVAEAQRGEAALQRVDDLVDDRLLHEQPGARAAHVALVEEDAAHDALDGLVDGRVVEDDVGGLAAELEGHPLVGAGRGALDQLADLGRAGERDLVDAGVLDERAAGLAGAGEDVDDARAAGRPAGRSRRTAGPSAGWSRRA